jgi:hypothetical protein
MSPVHTLGQISVPSTVEIVHERHHLFAIKPGTKHVCLTCGANRLHPDHGAFSWQSSNRLMDNRFVRNKINSLWQDMLLGLLATTGLPRPCAFIEVMGQICFPDRKARDEDNHRYPYSKFLGDALQRGGYLINDDWGSFRFRDLDRVPSEPGVQWTRLLLMPELEAVAG